MKELILNKMPSPTWSWLKMNSAKLSLDSDINLEEEKTVEITVKKGEKTEKPLVIRNNFTDGKNVQTQQIIKTEENAEITVIIVSSSEKNSSGFNFLKTELHASPYSKINLIKVQMLGENFIQVDETNGFADDSAEIEVTHVILGGEKTYISVSSDLKGYKSGFKSDTGYFSSKNQILDMNYVVNHFGKKTSSLMNVYGSLKDEAKKTYRGTIDLKNGASGAVGEEQEDVLLLSENVVNNSIPVILCTEEDVQGEHGATIGRIAEDTLLYMQSRGIGKDECEKLLSRSKVQRVANKITDENILNETNKFMDELFGVN